MVQLAGAGLAGLLAGIWGPAPGLALLALAAAMVLTLPRPFLAVMIAVCGLLLGRSVLHEPGHQAQIDEWVVATGTTFRGEESLRVEGSSGPLLIHRAPAGVCPGDRLELAGRRLRPAPSAQPGRYDPWRALIARGARARFQGQILGRIDSGNSPLCRLRQAAVGQWYRHLEPADAWLASALTVGARPREGREAGDDFRSTGLAHLLAVSGLHVGMVIVLVLSLLRWLPALSPQLFLDRRRCILLSAAVATAVGAWCGWPVGGNRIITWLLLAWALPRRPVWVTGVLSLAGMLLWDPSLGADPGFLLSHGAALLLVGIPWARRGPLQAATVAGLGTLPLLWCLGFEAGPFAVLSNLLIMPFFLVVFAWIWICFLAATTLGAYDLLSWVAAPSHALRALADRAADSPLGWQYDLAIPMLSILLGAFIVVALVKRQRLAAAVLGLFLCLSPPLPDGLRYWQLPVGHGDMAYLRLNDHHIVIDTGPSVRRLRNQLMPLLAGDRPDRVIISHEHPDHLAGLPELCRRFPGLSVQLPQAPTASVGKRAIQGCRSPRLSQGLDLELGGLHLKALAGPDDWVRGPNDRSLGLAVEALGHRLLFLGDMEADRELDLAGRFGPAQIVKVPHHGSRTSSGWPLIKETQPEHAVFSAGPDDPYGHPHPEVWQRWQRAGARNILSDRQPVCLLIREKRRIRPCPELAFLRPGPLTVGHGSTGSQSESLRTAQGGLGRQW